MKTAVLFDFDGEEKSKFAESENKNLGKALIYKRMKIGKAENTFTFHMKEIPYQVGIDPYNYLIDRLSEDNLRKAGER